MGHDESTDPPQEPRRESWWRRQRRRLRWARLKRISRHAGWVLGLTADTIGVIAWLWQYRR